MTRFFFFSSLLVLGGCAQVLGLGDFKDGEETTGGNGGSGASGAGNPDGAGPQGGDGGNGGGPIGGGPEGGAGGGGGGSGPESGTVVWAEGVGSVAGEEFMEDVAVTPAGDVYVLGYSYDAATFPIGTSQITTPGLWLTKLTKDGAFVWSHGYPFNSGASQYGTYVYGVSATDTAVAVGIYTEENTTIDFGSGPLAGAVVAKFDPAGSPIWVTSCGGITNFKANHGGDVAIDSNGAVVFAALTNGSFNCGGGGADLAGIVVTKLDPNTGTKVWSRGGSGFGYDRSTYIAIDSGNNVLIAGQCNSVDFGDGEVNGLFAAKLTATGANVYSHPITDTFGGSVNTIAATPQAGVIIGGSITGPSDFGGGPLTPSGSVDGFVLLLNSSGQYVASEHYGNGVAAVNGVTAGPSGDITAVGMFEGSLPTPQTTLIPQGQRDGFLLRLSPTDLKPAAAFRYGGTDIDELRSVTLVDNLYLTTGYYGSAIDFGPTVDFNYFGAKDAMVLAIAQ